MKSFSLLIFFLLLASGAVVLVYFLHQVYLIQPTEGTSAQEFVIEKGESVSKIASRLAEQGFIQSPLVFTLYADWKGVAGKFQTGSFSLKPGIGIRQIVGALTSSVSFEETITIIEGWSLEDIAEYLEKRDLIKSSDFYSIAGHPRSDYRLSDKGSDLKDFVAAYGFLKDKPLRANLEGFLFPDTYRINKDAGVKNIVRKMLDNFDKKLTPEFRSAIERQSRTIFDVITLASIVEKEVNQDLDRAMAADIFWRRIESNYPLQSDATINYITGKGLVQPSIADTKVESAYNTYKYPGLPPGPISNPGIASIYAVIYPQKNPYWYFLTTREGEVIYGKTYEEHLQNKAEYLK